MTIPTSINDLSTTASSNSPSGSDSVITNDDFLRALSAIIKESGATLYTAGGTADVITFNTTPAFTSYQTGQKFWVKTSGANTTNVTLNINSLGAKAVTKNGTNALVAGDIASGAVIQLMYDGTQFQIVGIIPSSGGGAVAWSAVTGKPTTVAGFGISDMASQSVAYATSAGSAASATTASGVSGVTLQSGLGTGNSPSFVEVGITSDERLKKNWRHLGVGIFDKLVGLKYGIYDRIDNGAIQVGVSAQSLQRVIPEAVQIDDDGYLKISQSATLAIVAELAQELLRLRGRVMTLEEK